MARSHALTSLALIGLAVVAAAGCSAGPEDTVVSSEAAQSAPPVAPSSKGWVRFESFPANAPDVSGVANWRISFIPKIEGKSVLLFEGKDDDDTNVITILQVLEADAPSIVLKPDRTPWTAKIEPERQAAILADVRDINPRLGIAATRRRSHDGGGEPARSPPHRGVHLRLWLGRADVRRHGRRHFLGGGLAVLHGILGGVCLHGSRPGHRDLGGDSNLPRDPPVCGGCRTGSRKPTPAMRHVPGWVRRDDVCWIPAGRQGLSLR